MSPKGLLAKGDPADGPHDKRVPFYWKRVGGDYGVVGDPPKARESMGGASRKRKKKFKKGRGQKGKRGK